jgi:predicted DNA-binding transcriptional regulator YafY
MKGMKPRKNPKPAGISEKVIRLLRNGYTFTHGDRIKKLLLSEEELITLLAAGSAVSHLGATFARNFQGLMDKMAARAGKPGDKGAVPILVKTTDTVLSKEMEQHLMTISLCMNEKRSVDLLYKAHDAPGPTRRLVDPYGLIFHEGVWILIGYCHLRRSLRSFALDRILDLKDRHLYFKVPGSFNLERYLSHSWGVFDDTDVDVTVRFKAKIADYILRKEKWHQSEKRSILPTGDVELSFTVAGVREIKKWIYSWLPDVEVVAPDWFRKQVNEELVQAASSHQ